MTTTAAAKLLHCSRRTVQRWCQVFGYPREGRDVLLTDEQVAELRQRVQPGPGNPTWRRPA